MGRKTAGQHDKQTDKPANRKDRKRYKGTNGQEHRQTKKPTLKLDRNKEGQVNEQRDRPTNRKDREYKGTNELDRYYNKQ